MSDTPNSATFGFAEMQEFVAAHSDSRVKAIWHRLVEAKEAASLRLTDAERAALDNAAKWLVAIQSADDPRAGECAATLRKLLERCPA